jgi:hypothetical protein
MGFKLGSFKAVYKDREAFLQMPMNKKEQTGGLLPH